MQFQETICKNLEKNGHESVGHLKIFFLKWVPNVIFYLVVEKWRARLLLLGPAPKRLGETNLVRVLLRTIQFMGVVSVLDLMALFRSWTFFLAKWVLLSQKQKGRILILLDYRFLQNDLAGKAAAHSGTKN